MLAIPAFTPQVMAARFRQALGTVIVTAWCPAQEFLASELQVTEHRRGARPKSAKREWGVAHQKAGGSSPSERANVATGQGLAMGMGEALNRGRPPGGPCSQTGSLTCADQLVCRAAVKRPPALGSSKTGATPWSGPRNQASLR